MSDVKNINGYDIKDSFARNEIAQMKINFQDGVDAIYNAIVAQGVTPSSSTPSDCATAITQIGTAQYDNGRSQGRKDVGANVVKTNPSSQTTQVSTNEVTKGKYYIVFLSYSAPNSYKECSLSGCDVIASQRIDITRTTYYYSSKLFFIKATSSTITFTFDSSLAGINKFLFELGNYE